MSAAERLRRGHAAACASAACLLLLISSDARADISVACAPERAFAPAGTSVVVRAWVTGADGNRLEGAATFSWHAQQGTISGGERATWTLAGPALAPRPGATTVPAAARVDVDVPGHGRAACDVSVFVELTPRPPPADDPVRSARLAARVFLLPNTAEPLEYGLRSYLIFTARPRDRAEEDRYVSVAEAYLQVFVPVEDFLVQHVRASRLNVTMVPVVAAVRGLEALDSPAATRSVAMDVVRKYDYARARVLLEDLGAGEIGGGPYLVARETASATAAQGKLVVDMSGVATDLARDWMTWFCWLTAQERSWSEGAVRRLGLNMRNIIAVTAETTPVVLASLLQSLYVLKSR